MAELAKRMGRTLAYGLAAALVVGLLYGLSAVGLGRIAVNGDFRETPDGVPVAIVDNGVHVDLVTPTVAAGHDWRAVLPEGAVGPTVAWLGFGWGAREFYLNTPTWADLKASSAVKALLGVGGVTVRVHLREVLYERPNVTVVRVSGAQYARLTAAIAETMRLDESGRAAPLPDPGYGRDVFLEAKGRYSPIVTCNEWASRVLAAAGVKTAVWAPFPFGVAPRSG